MFNNKIQQTIFYLDSEQDSILFARNLASNLRQDSIVTFTGDLGCGKTFICREIIKYFCGPNINVISPTFNLLQTYNNQDFTISHFDFYRLNHLDEVYELGIEDALQNTLCLIEWPEIFENLLPKPIIKINLTICTSNNKRICNIAYKELD